MASTSSSTGAEKSESLRAKPSSSSAEDVAGERDRRNWFLYQLFVRQEYVKCQRFVESQLRETGGTCEYALYLKGLLKRQEGRLCESLKLLQASVMVNPMNLVNRKQLGRALMLLGRNREAIEEFEVVSVRRLVASEPEDWEVFHCIGLCWISLKMYPNAIDALKHALTLQKNDATFICLADAYAAVEDYELALNTIAKALTSSPANPQLLLRLGQLHLKKGDSAVAFDVFGRCLGIDPNNASASACVARIMQEGGDHSAALSKYRVAIHGRPSSPAIWNNIGGCFFGKKKHYAALACLRKALYLRPFEWIIHYNCGVVHLSMGRCISAFHSLSTAANLLSGEVPNRESVFMYLGVCLSLMNDIENACAAYKRALQCKEESKSFLCLLNFTVTLLNSHMETEAVTQYRKALLIWEKMSDEEKTEYSSEVKAIIAELSKKFSIQ